MQATIAEIPVFSRIELTNSLTNRAQMPVYRHSESLLKPSSTADGYQAGGGTILPHRAVIKIELRVLADTPAKVRADEPVVVLRRRGARRGKTIVQCIPAIDGSRPQARELVVRRAGNCIARRSPGHA
jgi:hypothetical protein